ncbi:hypothetical protein CRG98_012818 [Punica granatum]|uniref:RNase H type-1 domain-containing protein n=1 Tax=Punica granatum TaxID=22663 RepID=A0A2I0KE70_PUNGR|nr:hypothetical protein CRG98_012818 [Punica granatum]
MRITPTCSIFHNHVEDVSHVLRQCPISRVPSTLVQYGYSDDSFCEHCLDLTASGWMKLNTDGSASGNPGHVGAGGVLRNELGRWIRGFALFLGTTNSLVAELELGRHFREFRVQHVYREGNKVADALARIGRDTGQDLMYFDNPPSDMAALVTYDTMGISSPRFVRDHTTDMVGTKFI